jgi:hypothetical protein
MLRRDSRSSVDSFPRMKRFVLLILSALYAGSAFAQDLTPPELKSLRSDYERSVAADKQRYLDELQKLEGVAISTNDPRLAGAVRREIAALSIGEAKPEQIEQNSDDDELKGKLIGTTWVWYGDEKITFMGDGHARWNRNGSEVFTWKITSASPLKVEGTTWNGTHYAITFEDGMTSGEIFEQGMPERMTMVTRPDPRH